jgi:glycosyltransferase involved in cell wall biosynthesis
MKNVWILNHYALKPNEKGGTRHFKLAYHLRNYGWKAYIIAASFQGNGNQNVLLKNETHRIEEVEGIPFLWIRSPEYKGNGLARILNMLCYTGRVMLPNYTRELENPDVIIGSSVHPFAAFAGSILARRYRVPFIFEVRDLWPQTLISMGVIKDKTIITYFFRKLEAWLYQKASKIVVLLPHAADYIVPLGIPAEKVVWIPNGVELSEFPEPKQRRKRNTDQFILMYFGAHGKANRLDILLDAMKLISEGKKTNGIKLRLIGDGPLKVDLMRYAKKLELNNVSFESPVPKNGIPSLASEADAFVIPIPDLPDLYKYGISPNKIFDYLAAARPIVISLTAPNNPVEESGGGITVKPSNPEKFAEAILKVVGMSDEERDKMGDAGRKYVHENHDFKYLSKCLANVLNECIKNIH